jgi:SNF2 family DNA or RNA helicase
VTSAVEPLRQSQKDFLEWARGRYGILLDGGMGVGKTRCAIEFARGEDSRLTLVIAPVSVLPAWEMQLGRYDSEVSVILHRKGSVARRCEAIDLHLRACLAAGRRAFILCNYEMSVSPFFRTLVLSRRWPLVILDESHRIKSPRGVTAKLWAQVRARAERVLAMTGTPMPHSPLDIFAQLRAVAPEVLGRNYVMFRSRFAIMGGFEGKEVVGFKNLELLRERMATCTYQIPRSVLSLDKPTDIEIPVELSETEWRAYRSMERALVVKIESGEVTAKNALTKLLRLQQITSGHLPLDDGHGEVRVETIGDAKRKALSDLLDSFAPDEPVVVFCRFRADLDAVHAAASENGLDSHELSGSRNELAQWQGGSGTVLAVQVQSGSVGIDLTRACIGVFYSTSWSLGEYDQARCRIDRPPQNRPVLFYHLIAQAADGLAIGTIDRQVQDALNSRREVVEAVMQALSEHRAVPDMTADGKPI